ncbi:DGQHR domain-containing protein [Paenibacillus hunanensis]|uniref:DNA sulfur modification protein DndB n=1 Tax=Paenibacillus hunanensis TaxID=539262 RepID=UPI00202744B0|nr:DNA sulfur modification protein DndB [Paenibacillus hunanensis]MCL9662070.1 DGQHR domain-containing protein [Paenibacillus hunanensis]
MANDNVLIYGNIDTINTSKSKGLMSSQMQIRDILQVYGLDKEVNRDLSYNRLPGLIKYYEKANSELGIYLPAVVFSFRENPSPYYNNLSSVLSIDTKNKLIVLDGQHRIKSLEKYIEKIKNDQLKEEFLSNIITVQIYFGLDLQDERKLFTDINSNSKKVSMSLITQYDSRDIINLLIQEVYRNSNALKIAEIELNKSKVIRPNNTAFSTGVRLKYFISYLLFGKRNISGKDEQILKKQYDDISIFLNRFFEVLFDTLPEVPGNVLEFVLGHESVQNAIAIYLNQATMIQDNEMIDWIEDWETEVEQLSSIDWSVKNNDWNNWFITLNHKRGMYKGFVETVTPDIVNYIEQKIN